jgi:hypothetical protein
MDGMKFEKMDQQIAGTIWTSPHPQPLVEKVCYRFGPRPAGSKALVNVRRMMARELRDIGALNVHTEPVPLTGWREEASRVEMLSPYNRVHPSIQHMHSVPGDVTGRLVYVQDLSPEALKGPGRRLGGTVALMPNSPICGGVVEPRAVRIRRLVDRGVSAVLCHGLAPSVGPVMEEVSGLESGQEMIDLCRRGRPRVKVHAAGRNQPLRCANLVAEIGPDCRSGDIVILSAHLDTQHGTLGANDNLSGVVTLLEVGRALVPFASKFKKQLRMILFTGEEFFFKGSMAYIRRNRGDLNRIRFVLNLDGLFPATAEGMAVMWAPEIRDYIDLAFRQTQCRVDVRNLFCMSSDYLPFILEGIAAARPADWKNSFPDFQHTVLDLPCRLPAEWIRMNAIPLAQLLIRMLMDPRSLPVRRKSKKEVLELLQEERALEAMHCYGFDIGR